MSFIAKLKANFGSGASFVTDQGPHGLKDMLSKVLQALDLFASDEILHDAGLAVGSTNTHVAHNEADILIGSVGYILAANASGVDPTGAATIPANKYGAWRLEVGADLTVDIVEAPDNDPGYGSAELALAALPAVAADHAVLGTVVLTHTSDIVPGTTDLTGKVTFADAKTLFEKIEALAS
jgi:hypothetical protein